MLVPSKARYERQSREEVLSNKKMEADFFCHCCQKAFPWYNNTGDIDFRLVHEHHKQPIADEGKNEPSNREYLCVNCHEDIHFFLDGFRVLGINLNYEFLTTVYIWYFSSRPSQEIKKKYPTEYHCEVPLGKSGVETLLEDFWSFVVDLRSTGHNLVLFDIYMYYLKHNYKLSFWTKRFHYLIEKPCRKEYNKILRDVNPAVIKIAEKYDNLWIE